MTELMTVATIGAVGAVVSAVIAAFALRQTRETHLWINSRLTELIETKVAEAILKGTAMGEKKERERASREP